jgi:tRNA A-37 threonylcarbamoyl transferase component Bud32
MTPDVRFAEAFSAGSPDEPREAFRSGNVSWEMPGPWRELLAAADGLPVERWLREGRATAVKQGAGRVVYRVDLPHRSFFLKHLDGRGFLATLKQFVRDGACRREYEKARELARRGVPAIVPVALGERRRGFLLRESYLVTEAIPNACSLDEYAAAVLPNLPRVERFRRRKALVEAAARLCAGAHAAGVFHDDLHGGNILLRLGEGESPDAPPQLYLADLPGVRLSGPLDARATRDSLAMLCAGFLSRTSGADRLRFWRAYVRARRDLVMGDDEAAAIRRAAVDHARRIVRRRDKRAWTDNRDFYRLDDADGTAHAVRELPRRLVEQLLHNPEQLWQANVDRPVKLSHGSLVVEAELKGVDRVWPVAVKRLRPKTWWKALASWFRRGRAPEAWYRGHALLARGIPTARPLAVYEPRPDSGRREGYLLTEWLTGAEDVHIYGWELARRDADDRRRRTRQSARALGRVVGRLHDQGFAHRDLKGNNLLLRQKGESIEPFLIDLDGLRNVGRVSFGLACRNLTRLAVSVEMHPWISRTDRLRFLKAYLREMPGERRSWKAWWRAVGRNLADALSEIKARGKAVA